jgi:hypothetical protein
MKLFSVDVESERLHGELAFAIGAVVRMNGVEVARFEGRAPTPKNCSDWVKANVLPVVKKIPLTHKSVHVLEEDFWKFWMQHRKDTFCLSYFGNQGGEAALFYRAIQRNYDARWQYAPSPLHELGTLMIAKGFHNVHDIDVYMAQNNIVPSTQADFHHPTFDAEAAAMVTEHLLKN